MPTCQACGKELPPPAIVHYCEICQFAFCQECEKSDVPSNSDNENWCCKLCLQRKVGMVGVSPYPTPVLSPAFSMSSYNNYSFNYDDTPLDGYPHVRGYEAEDLDTVERHSVVGRAEYPEKYETGGLLGSSSIRQNITSGSMSVQKVMGDNSSFNSVTLDNSREGNGISRTSVKFQNGGHGVGNFERAGDDSVAIDNTLFLTNIDTDPLIWVLPEPEDMEDERVSVIDKDDDDDEENDDGTKWGQPSSLSALNGDGKSYGQKEERQKAMMETMIGQLNILVSRFLTSEGIPVPDGEDAESWHNIVASLSREAALLVKPDACEGRAMDPGSYVKVKCISSGARSQSQVINGLVFKRNTAHKHMATKFKNPKILLLKGSLGQSAVGLSSFNSMEEEKDYHKSIIDMAEICHPNLILVEKSVSRDIQESLLAKGITLVYDMKLPRLKRIAQCTGSQIISSADILMRQNLKQCDSFHIEKFVEEHNCSTEGGKRPTKTLMFLEGCPKPLGCTVLLKGAHSDELKKVKHLMQYTVFAAYHLLLENSFFADQRAVFPDMSDPLYTAIDNQFPVLGHEASPNSIVYDRKDSLGVVAQGHQSDISISDGPLEKSVHGDAQLDSDSDDKVSPVLAPLNDVSISPRDVIVSNGQFHGEANNSDTSHLDAEVRHLLPGQRLSSVSAYLERFLGDSFLPLSSESISAYFNFQGKVVAGEDNYVPVSVSLEALDHAKEENENIKLEKLNDEIHNGEETVVHDLKEENDNAKLQNIDDETHNGERTVVAPDVTENIEKRADIVNNEVQIRRMDDIESVLDPQSILVLFSSQCVTKQIVCEQSHLSRIKYYGSFDMSLGRLLHDILLNQKHSCSSCGEPPDSHVYCYTHQNGNLTVLVKKLPRESILPGEAEEKIWMWTRCLKCDRGSEISKSSRRVVMSSAARGLSFGKFLELSFSGHSATSRLSRCGHSLLRDSLRFFGLGSRVAMFRYSPVEIYTVYKPPPVMEFCSPRGQEWFKRELNDVLVKSDFFFMEATNMLQKLKQRCASPLLVKPINILGSAIKFSDVEEILIREKTEFESSLLKAANQCTEPGKTENEILGLRWLKQELLLYLFIWDRRLHSIFTHTKESDTTVHAIKQEPPHGENVLVDANNKHVDEEMTGNSRTVVEEPIQIPIDPEEYLSSDRHQGQEQTISETELEIKSVEIAGNSCNQGSDSFEVAINEVKCLSRENCASVTTENHLTPVIEYDFSTRPSDHSSLMIDKNHANESILSSEQMPVNSSISSMKTALESAEEGAGLELKPDENLIGGEKSTQYQHFDLSQKPHNFTAEDSESYVWAPFSELRAACRNDLNGGSLQKFRFINSYTPTYLSPMHQLVAEESNLLHFVVGPSGSVISASVDDISSIIACALALSEDWYCLNNLGGQGKGESDKTLNTARSLTSDGFIGSSYWSSNGSSESDVLRSSQSLSSFLSDDLSTSGSDGSSFLDLHPEIRVGSGKVHGKGKYSVVCIHANQFYALRRRCCPSEKAYISSLSHCRKWDAQGGKSKAFFAKTMDDRIIVKQIKKTELESFLKFAPDYFKHIGFSLDSGSQTCLAKILGIYQVRQNKGGKEVKADLMVMENLLYGRNVSRVYDLKGALFSRYMMDSNDPECVLLDENFIVDMRLSPIYIGGKTKHLFQRAIWNDTSFLTSINVMDYSLLVGVDKQRHELVFGIIDYLRQYTWDKQLETWVKASLVVPKNVLPTVVSPKDYKKRFRKFMAKYFLTVPDSWSSEQSSGLSKFYTDGIS